MPLVSPGLLRPLLSRAPNKVITRTIHIPPLPRPTASGPSVAQRATRTARSFVSAFIGHLTTPGTLRTPIQISTRGLSHAATRAPGIKQGLSLPARNALARPFGTPHLPRAAVIPRSVAQVGLGTARSFGTARPIFQALAENVPIGVRGLVEADLAPHHAKGFGSKPAKMSMKSTSKGKGKQMMKENMKSKKTAQPTVEEEIEHYFPAPALGAVTTHVLIPLSPNAMQATSGRHSLRASLAEYMPIPELAAMHASYGTHALRVSSLFTRLDRAQIWRDPTVRCTTEAFGDLNGTCTTLRVTFEGWTEPRVRELLGDAGKGWCAVIQEEVEDDVDSVLGEQASEFGDQFAWDGSLSVHPAIDPADSLVLPTIDLSASSGIDFSLHSAASPAVGEFWASLVPRDEDMFSDSSLTDSDYDSDLPQDQAMYGLTPTVAHAPGSSSESSSSWVLGFSSRFVDSRDNEGAHRDAQTEYMF